MLKKLSRSLSLIIVPFIGSLLIKFLHLTNRHVFHGPNKLGDEAFILGCWHNDLLMLPYPYLHHRKIPRVKAMISNHFDGELLARTIKYFNIGHIVGSSNKNAARVLIQAMKNIKNGTDIAITPDGPRGPRHSVADGIIVIAQKTKAKVLLVSIKPSKYWQLNSWDKFIIPKPFGTINYYLSQELDIASMDTGEARILIEKGLLAHEN